MSIKAYAPVLKPVKIKSPDGLQDFSSINLGVAPPTDYNYGLALCRGNTTNIESDFVAKRVWNAVWNDYADFQLLNDEFIPGKCYRDTAEGAVICTETCTLGVIGIASDTFAHAVGMIEDQRQVAIAVAGWVLAFVDKEYPCGTPLTNDANGNLTEMSLEQKRNYPERLVAIYKKKEQATSFGSEGNSVLVNGRHWVKVK